MSKPLLKEQQAIYEKEVLAHGDSPKATLQNNIETRTLRFERLFAEILKYGEPFTVHEVGSGLCDLHAYLKHRRVEHIYSGTEIVPKMVEISQRKYPDVTILNRDLVRSPGQQKYDYTVLSGTLNLKAGVGSEWKDYCETLLQKMFEISNRGIAFNFLTTFSTWQRPELQYFDPLELFLMCQKRMSRFVVLDHAYPLYEATITVFKEEYFKKHYTDPAFTKYFSPAQ